MIDQDYESTIVNELSQYTGCTVVLANQTAPMPPYPYISYTIITPVRAVGGTYCDQKRRSLSAYGTNMEFYRTI